MAKYVIEGTTLQNLANAIRKVNGETKSYTPDEMIDKVTHIMESITYVLVDDDGNEVPAVFVEAETVLTATPNDIRIGTVAVTDNGVEEGSKDIPAYYVSEGYRLITKGSAFETVSFDKYDFTKLQVILCPWAGSMSKSTAADKVVIEESVYSVNSSTAIATVIRDDDKQTINLGITNDSDSLYVMRYFTYKEEY